MFLMQSMHYKDFAQTLQLRLTKHLSQSMKSGSPRIHLTMAAEPWFQQEMPLADDIIKQAAANSDKAVVFIGRTAGEDQDNADATGSYRLTDVEVAMIEQVFSCKIAT